MRLGAGFGLVVRGLVLVSCSSTAGRTPPSGTTSSTGQPSAGSQVELPFTGLKGPSGVAVDSAGNIYVADSDDSGNNRVLELPARLNTQVELPFTGLISPNDVAVDTAGNVYVTDNGPPGRVLKLPAGSNSQLELPFTGLKDAEWVAADTAGNVYATDNEAKRVVKLAAG